MPTNRYLQKKKQDAKGRISTVFDEYKRLLKDKTHPDNQGPVHNKMTQKTLQRLLSAADDMDSITPGEGIFGLIVLCLRSILRVKDENVRLEVRVRELEKELKRLQKQRG
tara:strand:+ start:445 stop:774 length:330 start_codon:yes stop_codon:yes gene_type:complete